MTDDIVGQLIHGGKGFHLRACSQVTQVVWMRRMRGAVVERLRGGLGEVVRLKVDRLRDEGLWDRVGCWIFQVRWRLSSLPSLGKFRFWKLYSTPLCFFFSFRRGEREGTKKRKQSNGLVLTLSFMCKHFRQCCCFFLNNNSEALQKASLKKKFAKYLWHLN